MPINRGRDPFSQLLPLIVGISQLKKNQLEAKQMAAALKEREDTITAIDQAVSLQQRAELAKGTFPLADVTGGGEGPAPLDLGTALQGSEEVFAQGDLHRALAAGNINPAQFGIAQGGIGPGAITRAGKQDLGLALSAPQAANLALAEQGNLLAGIQTFAQLFPFEAEDIDLAAFQNATSLRDIPNIIANLPDSNSARAFTAQASELALKNLDIQMRGYVAELMSNAQIMASHLANGDPQLHGALMRLEQMANAFDAFAKSVPELVKALPDVAKPMGQLLFNMAADYEDLTASIAGRKPFSFQPGEAGGMFSRLLGGGGVGITTEPGAVTPFEDPLHTEEFLRNFNELGLDAPIPGAPQQTPQGEGPATPSAPQAGPTQSALPTTGFPSFDRVAQANRQVQTAIRHLFAKAAMTSPTGPDTTSTDIDLGTSERDLTEPTSSTEPVNLRKTDIDAVANPSPFDSTFQRVGAIHQIPPQLLKAMAQTESSFDPKAVSPKGAQGLMQFMPDTQPDFNITNPFDAEQSITGAARYINQLLTRYNGDLGLALAAYNWGLSNVDGKAWEELPANVRAYASKVQELATAASFAPLPQEEVAAVTAPTAPLGLSRPQALPSRPGVAGARTLPVEAPPEPRVLGFQDTDFLVGLLVRAGRTLAAAQAEAAHISSLPAAAQQAIIAQIRSALGGTLPLSAE
jgi:hypothetical protein